MYIHQVALLTSLPYQLKRWWHINVVFASCFPCPSKATKISYCRFNCLSLWGYQLHKKRPVYDCVLYPHYKDPGPGCYQSQMLAAVSCSLSDLGKFRLQQPRPKLTIWVWNTGELWGAWLFFCINVYFPAYVHRALAFLLFLNGERLKRHCKGESFFCFFVVPG